MKKIAILGTGAVGQTLATGFVESGFEIVFGTQHPEKTMEWKEERIKETKLLSYEEAAQWGEAVVLCMKGSVAEGVVKTIAHALDGKVVMDTTNPIADAPPENGVLVYFTDFKESLMERLQNSAPAARFVKVFNSSGSSTMVHPDFAGVRPTMFICGNDAGAKQEVSEILTPFGWDAEDMGMVQAARAIEPLAILWCIPGFLKNDWNHALKLLRK